MQDFIDQALEEFKAPSFSTWKEKLAKPPVVIPWVVDSLLVQGMSTMIYGDGGLGKSWFASHVADCVASGKMVHGYMPVKARGNVLWYDNENGEIENDRRVQKLLDPSFGTQPFDVYMRETPQFHFSGDTTGFDRLTKDIEELSPKLVVIDSMVSALPTDANENDSKQVRAMIDGIMRSARKSASPPAFLFIHHAKKDPEGPTSDWPDYRGSTDFRGAVSFMIPMRGREEAGMSYVQFKWIKSRVGKSPKNVHEYRLQDTFIPLASGAIREITTYIPSESPKSFDDELLDTLKDVLRTSDEGTYPERTLIKLMKERFVKPQSNPYLENFLYRMTKDPGKTGVKRVQEPGGKDVSFSYLLA